MGMQRDDELACRTAVERALRERFGDTVDRFVHYPAVRHVAVHFSDGRRRLFDQHGDPLGREI